MKIISISALTLTPSLLVGNLVSAATVTPDRGLVALVKDQQQVYLGWQLLEGDALEIGFDVYRVTDGGNPVKLNAPPVRRSTSFVDRTADSTRSNFNFLKSLRAGHEPAVIEAATLQTTRRYVSIPLLANYSFSKVVATAEIPGDWREEIITSVPGELRICTTTIPATRRHAWRREDLIYRNHSAPAR